MGTITVNVELHLSGNPELIKKYGKKIKAVRGHYSECRGYQNKRFVTVPATETDLINVLVQTYPWGNTKTTMVARESGPTYGNALNNNLYYYSRTLPVTPADFFTLNYQAARAAQPIIPSPVIDPRKVIEEQLAYARASVIRLEAELAALTTDRTNVA